MNTSSSPHSCVRQSTRYDQRFAKLQRQLRTCKMQLRQLKKLREQHLWTKFVGEWLLHKFGFDVQLRIQMHKDSLPEEVESEDEDDDDDDDDDDGKEEEDDEVEVVELVRRIQQPEQISRVGENSVNVNVVSYNRNIKRRRADSVSEYENCDITASSMSAVVESAENLGYIESSNKMKNTIQTITTTTAAAAKNSFTEVYNNYNVNNSNNTISPIKMEMDHDDLLCYERNDYNFDNQSTSSFGSLSNKTLTTKTGHVIHIVHEDDEEVDIKYHSLYPQSEFTGSEESSGDLSQKKNDDSIISSNRITSGVSGPGPSSPGAGAASFETLVHKLNYADTFFNFNWILQMKKYQPKVMPYTMFIKRDDIRQWFEYIPNNQQPALGRYRCRLCYKYVRKIGLPTKYWGPMESSEGQLKKSDTDNRNTINLHVTRKSHQEILLKLKKENSEDFPQLINFSKVLRKQLLDSLERE